MSQSSEQRSSLFLLDNNDRWSSFLFHSYPCLSFPRSVNVESSKDDGANGDMSMPDQFLWPWRDVSIVSEYEWVSIGWEWKEDVCLGNNVDGSWSRSIPLSNIRSMLPILKIIGLFDSKETREREKSIGIDVNEEFYLSTRRWLEPSPQVLIGEFDGCHSDRRYGCFRKRVDQYPIRQRICSGLAVFPPLLFIEDFYPGRISLPSWVKCCMKFFRKAWYLFSTYSHHRGGWKPKFFSTS